MALRSFGFCKALSNQSKNILKKASWKQQNVLSGVSFAKFQSTEAAEELVKVTSDEKTGVCVLQLNRKPVNSLNLELLTQLNITLDKLERDGKCNGLIITSALPKIFSAGLDIKEMYKPDRDRVATFWSTLQDFYIKLYGSKLVTIAAINGNSPAGGCLTAIATDYRIMAEGKYRIGLNETLLGIVAPFWFQDAMKATIGHRETEKALQLGTLYTAEEALKIGLVDKLVPETEVVNAAMEEMAKWLKIPAHARQISKENMRAKNLNNLIARKDSDIENFVKFVTKDSIQKSLEMYLQMLQKPKAK